MTPEQIEEMIGVTAEICAVSVEVAQVAMVRSEGDVMNAAVACFNAGVVLVQTLGEHFGKTPEEVRDIVKGLVDTLARTDSETESLFGAGVGGDA